MTPLLPSKAILRKQFRLGRMNMSSEEHQTRSKQLSDRLFNQILKHLYQTVAIFIPIRSLNEPDITALLWKLNEKGIHLHLPIVDGDTLMTVLYEVNMGLIPSFGGTMIPQTIKQVDPDLAELILVPLIAVDLQGIRLGYGKGFYDRFLVQRTGIKWGVCFDEEVVDALPFDHHDQKMDAIITDKRFISC